MNCDYLKGKEKKTKILSTSYGHDSKYNARYDSGVFKGGAIRATPLALENFVVGTFLILSAC